MTPTIRLLEREISCNKLTLTMLHMELKDIVDVIEKNEYISAIEELQNDNLDYIKSIEILSDIE